MKRLMIALFTFIALASYAQEVIDFMGIPVDGSVSEMMAKLQEKGFQETEEYNTLKGLLDGVPVRLTVCESRDKVYEIVVCYYFEGDNAEMVQCVNNLVGRFRGNSKYKEVQSEMITEDDLTESKLKQKYLGYYAHFTKIGANGYVAIGLNRLNYMLGKNNGNPPEKDYQLWVQMKYVNAANSPVG